ncbi:MAG TPA: histidinol-phosphate transaminase, partial [Luteimonas sp.]|nr:histidinol-phosphate transaminase [Luteimonas sp.]
AYDPGHDLVALRRAAAVPLLELGSNENPYGPSPRAMAAVAACLGDIHRYPDPRGGDLRAALARRHGVDGAQVVLGNGSHELLMQLAQVFAERGDEVVVSAHAFAVFAIAARAAGASVRVTAALGAATPMPHGHDLQALLAQVNAATRLIYLANPNNPTGTWYPRADFEAFIARVPGHVVVVVDEAYAELADAPDYASAIASIAAHPNLVVTRTFSKAHGLAGLRVGYAIASLPVAAMLERIRESFNVGGLSLAAAEAALADSAHLEACRSRNAMQRDALGTALRARGFTVTPSQANFLLVGFGVETTAIEAALLAQGVVLRPMAGYGLPNCLRISIGDAAGNARLLHALDAWRG